MVTPQLIRYHVAVPRNNLRGFIKESLVSDEVVKSQSFVWCSVASSLAPIRVMASCSRMKLAEKVHKAGIQLCLNRVGL